jgi:hypothetical protein
MKTIFKILLCLATLCSSYTMAASNLTGMYWNPSEPGWGISVDQKGDTVVAVIYTYADFAAPETCGKATWHIFSGKLNSNGSLSATVYSARGGTGFDKVYVPNSGKPFETGTATLTMDSTARSGTLVATIGGRTKSVQLSEFVFYGPGFVGYPYTTTGMAWGGADQSGWGLSVTQQSTAAFGVLYTYDDTGLPRG